MRPRAAHRSREHSYLVTSRDECCDNDDSFVVTYLLHALGNICYNSMGAVRAAVVFASWFERAQFAWSRFATGAATMTTRHSTTSALIYWGDV